MREYLAGYTTQLSRALDGVLFSGGDPKVLDEIKNEIETALCLAFPIFLFGNGGSAAIAEHIVSDLVKCVGHDTSLNPFVMNLSSNAPLMTCLANDYDYASVYAKQLDWYKSHGCVAIGISSSGNSPNIIQAFRTAKQHNMKTIALVGFDGGRVLNEKLAHHIIHVKSSNYGIVEDAHMAILHAITQKIRLNNCKNPETLRL